MKDVCIAIRVGSPHSTISLVKRTFNSIANNIGNCEWKILLSLGKAISDEVRNFVLEYVQQDRTHFTIFQDDEVSWAQFINKAIELSNGFDFFIKSHDDIELLTPNYFPLIKAELERIGQDVGWISITDIAWRLGDWGPSVREGYHIDARAEDAWQRKKLFEMHTLPEHWWRARPLHHFLYTVEDKIRRRLKLDRKPYPKPSSKQLSCYQVDLPKASVRCHAPFNHFVMIKREVLLKIGGCEDWSTKNALLVDEDWGLKALRNNLPNIWIPHIEYTHKRGDYEAGGTRSWDDISKNAERVHRLFYEKWGFHEVPTDEELKEIKEKFHDTLIPWSAYRRSYEWDYI